MRISSFSRNLKYLLGATGAIGTGVLLYDNRHAFWAGTGAQAADLERFPGVKEPFIHLPKREAQVNNLKKTKFDILVIGGGATGTGIALDAATRGLSVGLVERDDFSSGTSSRSTKLIHGGVRYLEKAVTQFDFGSLSLVFEALHERSNFLNNAPHLTRPLPIMTPIYKWWEGPYYWMGLKFYDLLAAGGNNSLARSRWVSAKESLRQFPMLSANHLLGTVVYYDGQMDDSRMNISLALTAAAHGATVANHVEVQYLTKDAAGKVNGARVKDLLTKQEWNIEAKVVVNATGPYADWIRKMSVPDATNIITPSSGVHVVLPDYYSPEDTGLIVPKTKDGRVVFMLPWQGETVAGTTDASTELTYFPRPHEEEINFILEAISDYLKVQVRRSDVKSAWSGIRPLAKEPGNQNTASISRDAVLEVDKNNLVTITGGKWTTYRKMAEDAVTKSIEVAGLKPSSSCKTRTIKMIGADNWEPAFYTVLAQNYMRNKQNNVVKRSPPPRHPSTLLPSEIAKHLSFSYGTRSQRVAQLAQEGFGSRLSDSHPYLEAEVIYAAQEEYACTAVDVLARRTRLAFIDAEAATQAIPRVVDLMGSVLGWDSARKKKEIEETQQFMHSMTVGRTGPLKNGVSASANPFPEPLSS